MSEKKVITIRLTPDDFALRRFLDLINEENLTTNVFYFKSILNNFIDKKNIKVATVKRINYCKTSSTSFTITEDDVKIMGFIKYLKKHKADIGMGVSPFIKFILLKSISITDKEDEEYILSPLQILNENNELINNILDGFHSSNLAFSEEISTDLDKNKLSDNTDNNDDIISNSKVDSQNNIESKDTKDTNKQMKNNNIKEVPNPLFNLMH